MFRPSAKLLGKMSWTRFRRNVNAKCLQFYGAHLLSYCQRDVQTQKSILLQRLNAVASRGYCDSKAPTKTKLPRLQEDHYNVPNFFQVLKSNFQLQWVVSSIETTFDVSEFLRGCLKAQQLVSQALSRQDYESLEGLVAKDAIDSIRNNIDKLTDEQRNRIKVEEHDMQYPLIYEVNVKKEAGSIQTVEILVVTKYMKEFDPSKVEKLSFLEQVKNITESTYICNYNFVRKYKDDIASDWAINFINHYQFKPFSF